MIRSLFFVIAAFLSLNSFAQDIGPDRLVLLGTKGGPSIRDVERFPTSNALIFDGKTYIIDAGYGVTQRLIQAKIPVRSISKVFITHHHSDHNLEYGTLLYNAWVLGNKGPIESFGPQGMRDLDDGSWLANRFDVQTRIADEGRPDPKKIFTAKEYTEGLVVDVPSLKVTAFKNSHPPIEESYALKFEAKGMKIVFSGDTTYVPAMAKFAEGADYLVHEVMDAEGIGRLVKRNGTNAATLLEHLKASHTLAEDVGRIAAAAKAKTLVLTHFVPFDDSQINEQHWVDAVRKHFSGPVIVGRDLLSIPLSKTK